MIQQVLAIAVILYFIVKLYKQKQAKLINGSEFLLWFVFWFLAGIAIIFIKKIDVLVASLGFSSSGIDVLLYLSMVILFYLVFRLRIRLERQEKNITKIVRDLSIKNEE